MLKLPAIARLRLATLLRRTYGWQFGHEVENPLDGVVLVRADALEILLSGGHVELDDRQARAILAAVVLFLHEEIQPAQTPGGVAMPIAVVGQAMAKSDHGQPTVVIKGVAHCGTCGRASP
jgi:hypothetical protein